jgi:anaerobic ribonucleoside-triphosphate reductase
MVNKDELASNGVVVDGVEISNDERQACEVWTRVMGYYRPVAFFNTGKKGEYHERVEFVEPNLRCDHVS